jgi:hypothetical protein
MNCVGIHEKDITHIWFITLLLAETRGTVECNVLILVPEVMVEAYNTTSYLLATIA